MSVKWVMAMDDEKWRCSSVHSKRREEIDYETIIDRVGWGLEVRCEGIRGGKCRCDLGVRMVVRDKVDNRGSES